MGPAQREHTIGGKPLDGFVGLRRTLWRTGFFGVGSDIWWPSIDADKGTDPFEENDDRDESRRGK